MTGKPIRTGYVHVGKAVEKECFPCVFMEQGPGSGQGKEKDQDDKGEYTCPGAVAFPDPSEDDPDECDIDDAGDQDNSRAGKARRNVRGKYRGYKITG